MAASNWKEVAKMGLIRSVDNIQNELQKQKELQLIEKIEKRKEKQQKENLKRYKNELELYLKSEFDQYFKKFGSEYIFEFYNKNPKSNIKKERKYRSFLSYVLFFKLLIFKLIKILLISFKFARINQS